jgi:outer membrane lipoprotein SlyB
MKKITAIALVAALTAVALTGCSSAKKDAAADTKAPAAAPKQASMGVVNSKCPMMLSHPSTAKTTCDYNGQKVGFCCGDCVAGWNKLTDAQKAEKLAAAK